MAKTPIDPLRLRQLRDKVILHLYNEAATDHFNMHYSDLAQATGLSADELSAVVGLLDAQGLEGNPFTTIGSIGLSDDGMREAERLGPIVAMREPVSPSHVNIHANYSVVQVAGANSNLTASLSIHQSKIEKILHEIEQAIPALPIAAPQKEEAKGLVTSLRESLKAKLSDAGMRAIGGALGSILVQAGSPLGQRLMELLNIAIGR